MGKSVKRTLPALIAILSLAFCAFLPALQANAHLGDDLDAAIAHYDTLTDAQCKSDASDEALEILGTKHLFVQIDKTMIIYFANMGRDILNDPAEAEIREDIAATLASYWNQVALVGCAEAQISLSKETVIAGETITLSITGLGAEEEVKIEMHSTPVVLEEKAKADVNGNLQVDVKIPETAQEGNHQIKIVRGEGKTAKSANITVKAPKDSTVDNPPAKQPEQKTSQLPSTGVNSMSIVLGLVAATTVAAAIHRSNR